MPLVNLAGPGSRLYVEAEVADPGGGEPDPEATLWVNSSTGDDSRSKATVAGSAGALPWATPQRAMWGSTDWASPNASEAADAGDVVDIAAGTYSAAGHTGAGNATWYPANSGTSGNPIVFQANGTVTLELTSEGTYLGNRGESYIVFRGFTCDDSTDLQFTSGGICYLIDGSNITFDRCTLIGRGYDVTLEGNNYSGVFITSTDSWTISNCRIRDFGHNAAGADENACGVDTYNNAHTGVIEHCWISGCGSGVYHKADSDFSSGPPYGAVGGPVTIRYTLIDSNTWGIRHHRSRHTSDNPFLIHNCIIANSEYVGYECTGFDEDGSDPQYARLVNCTFYNNSQNGEGGNIVLGGPHTGAALLFQNCLVVGGDWGIVWTPSDSGVESGIATFVRNLVNGNTTACQLNGSNMSLATWAAQSGISDTDSISTAAAFVDAANGDFHLVSNGQAALTLGRAIYGIGGADNTTIPAGAYITGSEQIGIES